LTKYVFATSFQQCYKLGLIYATIGTFVDAVIFCRSYRWWRGECSRCW